VRPGGERRTPANTLNPPHHALTVITENADPSLVTQGLVGDKPCLVTVDNGPCVAVARPNMPPDGLKDNRTTSL
jgi:hypothetical protein